MSELIECYNKEQQIPNHYRTVITMVQVDMFGLQLRFESSVESGVMPICQYAYWDGIKLCYANDTIGRWFLPSDVCFETFSSAERYRDNGPQ